MYIVVIKQVQISIFKAGFGNTEYMSILYNLLLPVAYEVNNFSIFFFQLILKL